MKNQKRVFRTFQYRETEIFAGYLHEQSMKGWHFKEWKFGLVFEKGEPADIRYAVEVFPKGKEEDLKPEEDAMDYAAYCEAAGWEFVDGARKFCIFRQKKKDAAPIVTEEERFQNIYQAERKRWLSQTGIVCLLLFDIAFLVCTRLEIAVFENALIGLLALALWNVFWKLAEGLDLILWKRRSEGSENGQVSSLFYREDGEQRTFWKVFQKLEWWGGVLFLGGIFLGQKIPGWMLPTVLICVMIFVVMSLLLSYFRPARDTSLMIQVGVACLFWVICVVASLALTYSDTVDVTQQFPLVQADYRDMKGEPMKVQECEYSESIFGKMLHMEICYGEEPKYETTTSSNGNVTTVSWELTEGSKEQDVLYYVYRECYVDWLPEMLWERVIRNWNSAVDCTEDWGATEAKTTGNTYFVWQENKILVLRSDVELNQEQIQKIREKLGL